MNWTCRSMGWVALACAALPGAVAGQRTVLSDVSAYLMERSDEIAMARSSAPNGIGDAADVWLLTERGYEQVARGTNGFACFVGRGWSGQILIGSGANRRLHPDVLDTKVRAPHCFNPLAVRSILPWQIERTRLLLDGVPAEEVDGRISAELEAGRLLRPEVGARP